MIKIWKNSQEYIEFPDNKANLSAEIAIRKDVSFTSIGNMYLPNPDPILKKQGKDISVYRDILSDSQVWCCVQSRKSGVKSLEYEINRGKTKSKDSDLIESWINTVDLGNVIDEILNATLYGYQPIEIIWESVEGRWLPQKIIGKPQEWFVFDDENQLKLRTKENRNGIDLPYFKFLCPTYSASYQNPYGESTLSRCFWYSVFRKGGYKFWVNFTEKYGSAYLVGKQPRSVDAAESQLLLDKLGDMINDAVCVIPDDGSIEFLEASGKAASAQIYEKLIDCCNSEISKTILGQNLTTEIKGSGSYAAASAHMTVRKDIVDSDKRLVERTINNIIYWIWELNSNSGELPVFEMYEEEDVDKALAERDQILAQTGVAFSKKYFIKNYGFEEEDFEILQPQQQQQNITNFAESADSKDPQKKIDELINLASSGGQIQNMLKPLVQLIEGSSDYNEALEKLAEVYPDMDDSDLITKLETAYFIAEMLGRINADR